MRKCVVCGEREIDPEACHPFCRPCRRSWWASSDEVEWAAKRARYYERRRARKDTAERLALCAAARKERSR